MATSEARQAAPTVACCGMSATTVMDWAEAESTATLLKAVADPVRLQLLSLIRAAEGHEACVCDLTPAVGLSQPSSRLRTRIDGA